MKKKIYAFIDSQNLNLGVRAQGWKLDFKEFKVYLTDKLGVSKCYLFIGMVPGNEKLYRILQEYGYTLIFKPTLEIRDGSEAVVKGNVDAELVLHPMIQFKNYDKAVIITGDGYFHCLLEYLENQGKLGSLIIPNPHKYSSLLRRFRSYSLFIDKEMRGRLQQK